MKAADYLKAKGRMCNRDCRRCSLRACDDIGLTGCQAEYSCIKLERDNPEQAVEIVEKWAKEHPVKTYLSVLLEKFPNVIKYRNGNPELCPHYLFGESRWVDCSLNYEICKKCWNREYKEDKDV